MKRKRFLYVILCLIFVLSLASTAFAQSETEDLAGIYKNYFKLLIDGEFTKAWDGLARESKLVIAELIAKEAEAPSDKVLAMLNDNENRLRDSYFRAFREGIGELLDEIYGKGKYTVKKQGTKDAVITIDVQNEPKDFGMIKEDGKWKVNFFKDLSTEGEL
jgi:hypothetical protein